MRTASRAGSDSQLCRVTLSAPVGELDVSVPFAMPVAELMDELVAVGVSAPRPGPAWQLETEGGHPLRPDATLAESEVEPGSVLILRRAMIDHANWPLDLRTRIALPARLSGGSRFR